MRTKVYLFLLLSFFSMSRIPAQMVVGPDTLVGTEWIRYDQDYYRFTIPEDGVYRITASDLQGAGIDPGQVTGQSVRLYSLGQQVPVFVSTDDAFGPDDYIEFFGYRNRGEMDRFLFYHPQADMLNPLHSLYTDQRPYYLKFEGTDPPLRVIQVPNVLNNPPAPIPFYIHTEQQVFTTSLHDPYFPVADGGAVSYSSYIHGEGFSKGLEATSTVNIPATDPASSGPDALVHLRFASANYQSHSFPVYWNEQLIFTLRAIDIEIIDTFFTVPSASLLSGNQLKINSNNALSRLALAEVTLTYPRLVSAANASVMTMTLPTAGADVYAVVDAFHHQGTSPILYTADGKYRMMAEINGQNQVHFLWPKSSTATTIVMLDPATQVRPIGALTKKRFTDITADDTEYIIITHPDLMDPGTSSDYVQYRMSPAGGNYRAKAYSILDLYDQFGYGIEKHPQAIRNFVEFIHRHWTSAKMIFIVGRAIEYNRSRYAGGGWEPYFFVPTFGRPGGDNLLAATVWDLVPRYPVGRLAATNRDAVHLYLDKVREHDMAVAQGAQTLGDKSWIKNVMHIAGGKTADEQVGFRATLDQLGEELAASDFGARIYHFQKESSDIIGESQSKQIEKLLHDGCSILNYLGHSSASTFEFTINDAAEWNNKGRYPIFSAMGCSAGQIHGTNYSLSDRYVQIADEGAIAFISGSGSQFPGALVSWARPWYDYIGNLAYGSTLGESILYGLQAVSHFVEVGYTVSNPFRFLLEQQTFQGDPALRVNPLPGPDYLVDRASVSLTPEILNTALDSFTLQFSIFNIGRNLRQETTCRAKLQYPDGSESVILQDTFSADRFESILRHRLPMIAGLKPGSYRLLISVDPDQQIAELPAPDAESNNDLRDNLGVEGIQIVLLSNVVTAVYPDDYAIVNKAPVLVASSSNAFASPQNIHFEVDTTALFNSPLRIREVFPGHGALLKWSPPLNWIDNTVYYWRVSYDSLSPNQGYLWSRHSFLYKATSPPGWNQSHFYQYTDDVLEQVQADSLEHNFDFDRSATNFRILNRYQHPETGGIPFGYIDNVYYTEFFSKFTGNEVDVFVVVVDPVTGEFMFNPNPGRYGSFNNLSYAIRCFPYRTDVAQSRQALIHFIRDTIPDGSIVFLYTYQRPARPDYFPQQWTEDETMFGESIFSLVEHQFPTSAIRTLAESGSKPYIVSFRKGMGGIQEVIAADTSDVISLSYDILKTLPRGMFVSTLVGPASRWYSIQWDVKGREIDSVGTDTMQAWALSADLTDTLWISNQLLAKDTNISEIDARQYPYLQLSLSTEDTVSFVPTALQYWRVLYDGFPELVINPDIGFLFVADTLYQGETMSLATVIENLSDIPADSIPLTLRISGEQQSSIELRDTILHLAPNTYLPVSFTRNTADLSGDYQVFTEINPGRSIPELNYANNIGVLPMHVITDKANPVLDVTFDGFHIQDGDIVAARPLIAIRLHDENAYALLRDTTIFEIYLQFPSAHDPAYVSFTQPWVSFFPADGAGPNIAVAELRPDLFEEGIYELHIQAHDASGNPAGDNAYFVSFEVIHHKAISHLYNFPNPFRDATRFIYTLTGEGSPAFYQIEIISASGVPVRTISQEELGPLAVGTHPTWYAWDGTDQNGSPLPAGVYFYHLVARDENEVDYDRHPLSGDARFYDRDWGKLILVR